MGAPAFTRAKKETDDELVQMNVLVRKSDNNWVTRAANLTGRSKSEFIREVLANAREEFTRQTGHE